MRPLVYTICFHGTSLTSGDTRHWQVEACRRLQLETGVEVINIDCGLGGTTTVWGRAPENFNKLLKARAHANVIEFSYNDSAFNTGITTTQSRANYAYMHNTLKANKPDAEVLFATMNNAYGGASDPYRPTLPTFYQAMRDEAAVLGVEVIDSAPLWAARGPMTHTDFPDEVHPVYAAVVQVHVPNVVAHLLPHVQAFKAANT